MSSRRRNDDDAPIQVQLLQEASTSQSIQISENVSEPTHTDLDTSGPIDQSAVQVHKVIDAFLILPFKAILYTQLIE